MQQSQDEILEANAFDVLLHDAPNPLPWISYVGMCVGLTALINERMQC